MGPAWVQERLKMIGAREDWNVPVLYLAKLHRNGLQM